MKSQPRTPAGVTVHVKGKNMSVSPSLRDQVASKMVRLDKYHDRLTDIEVELSTESTRAASDHNRAEATTQVMGHTIRVASVNADMQAAVDACVDKLYRQLNRQKERLKSHHARGDVEFLESTIPSIDDVTLAAEVGQNASGSDEVVIVVEQVDLEPQFADEAVEELRLTGREFHVFLNARNEQINVVYRHHDGTFGLIQPRGR